MTNLSAPFQFLLCLSLFLVFVPPPVHVSCTPPQRTRIFHRQELLQHKYQKYATSFILQRDSFRAKSMGHPYSRGHRYGRVTLEQNSETEGNGEYFIQAEFGTQGKQLFTVLDTGSDVSWIQCQPCESCYAQDDPIFDPATSKSYKPLACGSQQCRELNAPSCNNTRKTCLYGVQYGDGTATVGDFATETISIANTKIPNIAIGCGHSNKGLFAKASGVLGLGRGPLSFISQAKYPAFSYCLTDRNSRTPSILELGSSATFNDAAFTTPLLSNSKLPSFYFVGLTGISVNQQVVHVPSLDPSGGYGGAIVDCGATVTRFPQNVYNQFRDAFVEAAVGLNPVGGYSLFDTCYAVTSKSEANFPTVAFHFGADNLTLPRNNVMFSVGNSTCFGFATTTGLSSIIGNHQQQGIRVSFDQDSSVVGFLPGNC